MPSLQGVLNSISQVVDTGLSNAQNIINTQKLLKGQTPTPTLQEYQINTATNVATTNAAKVAAFMILLALAIVVLIILVRKAR